MRGRHRLWKILEIIWGSGWCFFLPGRFPLASVYSSFGQNQCHPIRTWDQSQIWASVLVRTSLFLIHRYALSESHRKCRVFTEPLLFGMPSTQIFIPLLLWEWRKSCLPSQLHICRLLFSELAFCLERRVPWVLELPSWFPSFLKSWSHRFSLPW